MFANSTPRDLSTFVDNPNYREWNQDLAYRETQAKEEEDENWKKLSTSF